MHVFKALNSGDIVTKKVAASKTREISNDCLGKDMNSAQLYLISIKLSSRQTMQSYLNKVAEMLSHNTDNIDSFAWDSLKPEHYELIKEILRNKSFKASTINTYLAAMRGVTTKSFQKDRTTARNYKLIS